MSGALGGSAMPRGGVTLRGRMLICNQDLNVVETTVVQFQCTSVTLYERSHRGNGRQYDVQDFNDPAFASRYLHYPVPVSKSRCLNDLILR